MPTVAPKSLRAPAIPRFPTPCLCAHACALSSSPVDQAAAAPAVIGPLHRPWQAFSFPGLADITAGPLGDVPTTACKYGCNVVCYVLHAVHVVCCRLCAVCCLLSVARCMLLSAVYCTLFVVCCVGPQVSGDSGSIALVDVKRGTVISVRTHHWPGRCTAGRSPTFALPSLSQPHLWPVPLGHEPVPLGR